MSERPQEDKDKAAKKSDDDAIIAECMDRMAISIAADSDTRKDALDDYRFLKGDQWDDRVKKEREFDHRPCLTINKLPVTLHQVTNAQRQNVPSIKIHPVSDKDAKSAEIRQGLIRNIEYKSKADVCYDTAVNGAAAVGFGYFRLVTQYVEENSFDQEIAFKRIRNAFTVYMDSAILEVDGSDQQWCILSEKIARTEFKLSYPKADPCDFNTVTGMGDKAKDWASNDEVRVTEYYRIFREKATVVLLSNGESGWKDKLVALPEGVTISKERSSTRSTVQWFKLTATEVLERADIPCKWIPVFPVFGDELDIDGRVTRSGIIRNAKDPARMYNFWMTSATEEVGLRPKTPYIGAEGQFEGHEEKWAQANRRSYAFLEYKMKSLGGSMAPPPQRQPMADVPVGVLSMAAQASDDIKATTGIFDASLGARSNETSGRAINARDRQGETANYHYTDNLNITLRHAGRCMLDMIPRVYDGTRTIQLMGADNKVKGMEVNTPDKPEVDLTTGEFSVTVSSGPSYDTLRQEAVEGMLQTAQSWPKLMDIAGDKVVRSMDWPMADQIADRIEKTIPPELLQGEDGEEDAEQMVNTPNGPVPVSQVPQILQQMGAQMQEMQQALQEAESGIAKVKIDANSRERVAEINSVSKNDVAELQGFIQLLLQKLQPPPVLTAKALTTGENADTRPTADPAMDQTQQGGSLPMGGNTGPEIAQ